MLSPPTTVHAGMSIGGYELVHPLGKGGMAEVWLARRQGSLASRHVAIKLIADRHVGDSAFRRMFRVEAELSGLLTHANIVQVFAEGEEHGRSFLVMEWVDGVSLVQVRSALVVLDDAQRDRIAAYVVGQLLHALAYAHSVTTADGKPLSIVHRDVSPQNVLVSNQGEVKLTDFGVAHHVLEESSGLHVKGKIRYMAPEQLAGSTRAPTVDLYALGAILHELLDGRPFRAEARDEPQMFGIVIRGDVPRVSREVPRELEALRLGLLHPDPQQRLQSADAALEELARYPGYRDARRDLMQLCRALTGVDKPRAGHADIARAEATPLVRAFGTPVADGAIVPMPSRDATEPLPVASVAVTPATARPFVGQDGPGVMPEAAPVEDGRAAHDGETARTERLGAAAIPVPHMGSEAVIGIPVEPRLPPSQVESTEAGASTPMGTTSVSLVAGGSAPAEEEVRPVLRGVLAASMVVLIVGGGATGLMLSREQTELGERVETDARGEAQAEAAGEGVPSLAAVLEPPVEDEASARPTPSVERTDVPLGSEGAEDIEDASGSSGGSSPPGSAGTAVVADVSADALNRGAMSTTADKTKGMPAKDAPPPVHSTPACSAARDHARSAAAKWDWAAVIESTARKECWPRAERERWRGQRVKALAELGRFEQCARVGRGAKDEAVRRQASVCKERVQ